MSILRCALCGRRLLTAAAWLPEVKIGRRAGPAAAVGPTCARNAGLVSVSCRSVVRSRRVHRSAASSSQIDWLVTP